MNAGTLNRIENKRIERKKDRKKERKKDRKKERKKPCMIQRICSAIKRREK